jgi:signal transduction histidine kinase
MHGPSSANIKIALIVVALVIVAGTLWYTHRVVDRLLAKEREGADLYAASLEYIANSPTESADYNFVFSEVLRAIDFPIVLTDAKNNPSAPFQSNAKNIEIDTTLSDAEQEQFLRDVVADLDAQNPPIKVVYQDSIVIQLVHYGESRLITQLRWLPYVQLAIAAMFILIGYVGFSYIKHSEQSNIWVGMAKETAHQLGTPLSSVMGWIELLRADAEKNPHLQETLCDMENDFSRLQKIAERFSKIGSKPSLQPEDLGEVITGVIRYFQRRLPQMGKNIDIRLEAGEPCWAMINRELFEWVLENLVKNALDAIENGVGRITFTVTRKNHEVAIDVSDTGKGIDMRYRRDIFRPGYSTKERGWGLGLSLSKRIVESYHKGKLTLRESKLGKGTTFLIRLRA